MNKFCFILFFFGCQLNALSDPVYATDSDTSIFVWQLESDFQNQLGDGAREELFQYLNEHKLIFQGRIEIRFLKGLKTIGMIEKSYRSHPYYLLRYYSPLYEAKLFDSNQKVVFTNSFGGNKKATSFGKEAFHESEESLRFSWHQQRQTIYHQLEAELNHIQDFLQQLPALLNSPPADEYPSITSIITTNEQRSQPNQSVKPTADNKKGEDKFKASNSSIISSSLDGEDKQGANASFSSEEKVKRKHLINGNKLLYGIGTGIGLGLGSKTTDHSNGLGIYKPIYINVRWGLWKGSLLDVMLGSLQFGGNENRSVSIEGTAVSFMQPIIGGENFELYATAGANLLNIDAPSVPNSYRLGSTVGASFMNEILRIGNGCILLDGSGRVGLNQGTITITAGVALFVIF